jgi:hypothetical protein
MFTAWNSLLGKKLFFDTIQILKTWKRVRHIPSACYAQWEVESIFLFAEYPSEEGTRTSLYAHPSIGVGLF